MSDLIRREDVDKAIQNICNLCGEDKKNYGVTCGTCIIRKFDSILFAEPDNQVHLCGFCKYSYPECPAEGSDVIFGNGIGHDNVCACAKFEIKPERKKGKWQRRKDEDCWECSECHAVLESDDIVRHNFYYCYHCGADMMNEDGYMKLEGTEHE